MLLYIYMCVCVCVCVWNADGEGLLLLGESYQEAFLEKAISEVSLTDITLQMRSAFWIGGRIHPKTSMIWEIMSHAGP